MAYKVLIVDDEKEVAEVLFYLMQSNGFVPFKVHNGKEALLFLEKDRPDLILLDIMMPDMDGYEVVKRIKSNPEQKTIPVIMLTCLSDGQDFEKAIALGADWYTTKPFDFKKLLANVNYLLNKNKPA